MSKISLKHSGGNVVSLNSPTNAPGAADVAFKLPNNDGSNGAMYWKVGYGNGNLCERIEFLHPNDDRNSSV